MIGALLGPDPSQQTVLEVLQRLHLVHDGLILLGLIMFAGAVATVFAGTD
jgi:hypothetical protein